jgi:hypothetical protein
MVDSAHEARAVSKLAGAALRLVNEVAAESLIAAADRGETAARVEIEPMKVPFASGRVGRLYDRGLIEALEDAGAGWLVRACRIFSALGFAVATVPEVEREGDVDSVVDVIRSITINHLELGYATAQADQQAAASPQLPAVALPAAHLWRSRAETSRRIERYERMALAAIAEHAERGNASCRLPWRTFAAVPPDARQLNQLADILRNRGFRVEKIEASATLRVYW